MTILGILIPASLILGGAGLAAFFWSLRSDQYDDPEGDSRRILSSDHDDRPASDHVDRPASDEDAADDPDR